MLLYLTEYTRPDIVNAVREHSCMMDGATAAHHQTQLQIIKYVIDTKNHTLKMKIKQNEENIFSIQATAIQIMLEIMTTEKVSQASNKCWNF